MFFISLVLVFTFCPTKLLTIFVLPKNKGWRRWTFNSHQKEWINAHPKITKDKIKCRDCHIIMTSCMTSQWHHHDIIHDIMWSHHMTSFMTSSMTSSWHVSLSLHIHLTSVPTSVQRWSRQHIQCISLQYIFYTCIIQPTKSLHQLYGLGLAIGPTLGPKTQSIKSMDLDKVVGLSQHFGLIFGPKLF